MYLDPVYNLIIDKQKSYQAEAKVWRELPKKNFNKKIAQVMRALADRLEPQPSYSYVVVERTN